MLRRITPKVRRIRSLNSFWGIIDILVGCEWVHALVFFFQAEDGIRDLTVTGVQTCALPISHRKVNRVDMGTADKVCAVALAIVDQARRLGCPLSATSFVLLELGGAFTAAVAVAGGRIVDGAGGSAGALGLRGAGALDGEAAYLAGSVSKDMLFRGGAATVAGWDEGTEPAERLAHPATPRERVASEALIESKIGRASCRERV